jgi:hypothetical protein
VQVVRQVDGSYQADLCGHFTLTVAGDHPFRMRLLVLFLSLLDVPGQTRGSRRTRDGRTPWVRQTQLADALGVTQIIVAGHTSCGGVKAAMAEPNHGLVDHWLGSLRMLWLRHRAEVDAAPTHDAGVDLLVRLNVLLQVYELAINPTVLDAWRQGRALTLSGMVYDIESGLLETVITDVTSRESARDRLRGFDPA